MKQGRSGQKWLVFIFLAGLIAAIGGCGTGAPQQQASPESPPESADASPEPTDAPAELAVGEPDGPNQDLPPGLEPIAAKFTGDLEEMAERRYVRALVVYSKMLYFLDGAQQRGLSYESLKEFEKVLNEQLQTGIRQIHIVFLPVKRDELIPALIEGRGDIAAANLTITPERRSLVDFSSPLLTGVSEVLVTGPGAPDIASWDDLAEHEIHVRRSSSYFESLQRLNESRRAARAPTLNVESADEILEDEDLLEMVNAGLIPATIVDSHKAEFWEQIFDDIVVHSDLEARTSGEIAWAFRKNSPQLKEAVDEVVKTRRAGTLMGNILLKRYLKNTKWVRNSGAEAEMKKFRAVSKLFQKYAGQYDFDWLLVMAQAYQESRLEQNLHSRAGAVGVMQLMPSTAAAPPISIPDIENLDQNLHAGVKYLRHIQDRYFKDESMNVVNRLLFTFAAYNGGPSRIVRLRDEAARQGLDPDKWFGNVELVAAKRIGRETVQYVGNIYKYYLAYQLALERQREQEQAVADVRSNQ